MLDERWIRSLHVKSMRRGDLHAEREPHVLFQASTISALLDASYDGDLTFAELGERGDIGLGTLNALDGEMIAIDGDFFRADVDGELTLVGSEERTPFAVVTRFEPTIEVELAPDLEHEAILKALYAAAPDDPSFAVRVDGRFATVRARSVPPQEKPYRPLAEVVAEQNVFELTDVEGSMVGFCFPTWVEGIEVAGWHLHFADTARRRGGHVLSSRAAGPLRARIDPSNDLQVELPPAVELGDPDLAAETHAAIDAAEHGG
ncbi:MAG TPA: acetolactate decarboxylase [Solirubrobacterales bacterium]